MSNAALAQTDIGAFSANPRLRKLGQKVPMTAAQVKEYAKCAASPSYFIERYVQIVTIDDGLMPFKLHDYQKRMLRNFHNNTRIIVRAARQSGKTSTCAAYILWYLLFNENKTVAILANKEITSTEILSRVQEMYMGVPLWMQQGIYDWSKTRFELENKSKVISSATASNAIRGYTINLLMLDEFAFVPSNVADEFFTSVYPTLSSGKTAKMIICSTPKGMNFFYKLFTDATNNRNGFVPMTVRWDKVPGRGKKWEEEQRKVLGDEKFEQEMNVEFVGSAGTLISMSSLKNLAFSDPIREMMDFKLKLYEEPIKGHRYIMTCDVSQGKELDYSAFSIIDVTTMPYRQVAVYHNNDISAELYPSIINQAARYYNNAFVLVESNDVGSLVLRILIEDHEYENVFYTDSNKTYKDSQVTGSSTKSPGLRTTPKTKRMGCSALKPLIEQEQLHIQDFDTINELNTFVVRPNRTYAADVDAYDDIVMTLVTFAWLTTQTFFKELASSDARGTLYADRQRAIESEMPVMPRIVRATDTEQRFRDQDGVIWTVAGQEDEYWRVD